MQSSKGVTVALDTSAEPLLVAVEKNAKQFVRRRRGIKQEQLLFPALRSALGAAGAELKDVRRVFIVRGPGRFTGIRLSLTFASMLQALGQAQVRGATVFEVLRFQVASSPAFCRWHQQHPQGVLAVALHAFREEYFLQIFDGPDSAPAWLTQSELLARLSHYPHPVFLAGSDKNHTSLKSLTSGRFALAPVKDCLIQAGTLLTMAREASWAEHALEPLYLKPARFEREQPA